jgi:hypothetical protein
MPPRGASRFRRRRPMLSYLRGPFVVIVTGVFKRLGHRRVTRI